MYIKPLDRKMDGSKDFEQIWVRDSSRHQYILYWTVPYYAAGED